MARLWFKRRRFGWGWVPASKQGWLTLVAFVAAVGGGGLVMGLTQDDGDFWPVVAYLVFVAGASATLIRVTRAHGPDPHWRWGRKPDDDPATDY